MAASINSSNLCLRILQSNNCNSSYQRMFVGDRLILQGDLEMREELQMRTALIQREEVRWSRN